MQYTWELESGSELRVLTLIASATEIVCALGYRAALVGRSHECDYPADVRSLPQVTAPRLNPGESSRRIDEQVKELVREATSLDALGVYEISTEQLRELRPTHIITQTQCEVCAVSLRDVRAAVARVAGYQPRIVPLEPNAMADVWDGFRSVAVALGDAPAGDRLVADLQARINSIANQADSLPSKPSIAAIEWVDPLMAVGNWMPELIDMAGGRCLFGGPGEHSPQMTLECLLEADPDVILLSPCGFDINRTLEDLPILEHQPGWANLRAVQSGRVYVGDGNQFFNRPGPRLAETVEILAEILHPDTFDFGHRGIGWIPVSTTS